MEIEDRVGLSWAIDFLRKKLDGFDLSQVERFRFLPLHGRYLYHGLCKFPKEGAGYDIRCSVHVNPVLP